MGLVLPKQEDARYGGGRRNKESEKNMNMLKHASLKERRKKSIYKTLAGI